MIISNKRRGAKGCVLLLACLSLLAAGCVSIERASDPKMPHGNRLESVLIIGLQPVLLPGRQSGMIRHPLTEAFRYAEPVPQEVADKMTYRLFERLTRSNRHHFVSPGDAKSRLSTIDSPFTVGGDLNRYLRIGEALSANAFLAGYIWRWKDREGSELAVESPASVHFDLYLIRLVDKAVVWRYEYDKTQQSLAENLLDLRTFLRAKGRWLNAFELADLGLDEIAKAFPQKSEED